MVMGRSLRHALAALVAGAAIATTPAKAETVTVGLVGAISSTHWPIYIGPVSYTHLTLPTKA